MALLPESIKPDFVSIGLGLFVALLHLYLHGLPWRAHYFSKPQSPLSSKYLIFIYLLAFSLLTLPMTKFSHYASLLLMYILLFLYSLSSSPSGTIKLLIIAVSYLCIIWGILSIVAMYLLPNFPLLQWVRQEAPSEWWYYLGLASSAWLGFMLAYQIDLEMSPNYEEDYLNSESVSDIKNFSVHSSNQGDYEMIEMSLISKPRNSEPFQPEHSDTSSDSEHMSEGESMHSSRRNRLPPLTP